MTDRTKGILCIVFSAFCYSWMNVCVKMTADLPIMVKVFARSILALVIAVWFLRREHISFKPKRENFRLLVVRSVLTLSGTLFNFYAVAHIYIADANVLNKLSSFFAILFSFLFLKERITRRQLIAVVCAFVGAVFIIKPGFNYDGATLAALSGFMCGVSAGGTYAAVHALSLRGESTHYSMFFMSVFMCLVSGPFALAQWHPLTGSGWLALVGIGIFGAVGQYAITAAYSFAPAREVAVYDYTIVIFSGLWSFLLWGSLPDWLSLVGYAIIFSAFLLMHRQHAVDDGAASAQEPSAGPDAVEAPLPSSAVAPASTDALPPSVAREAKR